MKSFVIRVSWFMSCFMWCACAEEHVPLPPPPPVEQVNGYWRIHSILTDELEKLRQRSKEEYHLVMGEMIDSSYMAFENDSTFHGRFGPDRVLGRWEISSDLKHVITTDMKGEKEVLRIQKLSRDSMRLYNMSYRSGITLVMSRMMKSE